MFPSSRNNAPFHCSGLLWSQLPWTNLPACLGPGFSGWAPPPPGHTAPLRSGWGRHPLGAVGRSSTPVRGLAWMRLSWNGREARAVMGGLPKDSQGLRLCPCMAHTSVAGSWRPGLLTSGEQAGPVFVHRGSVSGICSSWPQQPSVAVWPGLGFASPCHAHHGAFSLGLQLLLCPLVSQNTP